MLAMILLLLEHPADYGEEDCLARHNEANSLAVGSSVD